MNTKHLRWIVGQVEEESDTLHTAVLLKISGEEAAGLQVDTHGTKDNGEIVLVSIVYTFGRLSNQASLSTNLGGNFVVWETRRGEDGNLLPPGNRVHGIDGRDTSGDHFFGVDLAPVNRYTAQDVCWAVHESMG